MKIYFYDAPSGKFAIECWITCKNYWFMIDIIDYQVFCVIILHNVYWLIKIGPNISCH